MHLCQKTPVFHIFSANHWKQSEATLFKIHLTVKDPIAKKATILFSNAEKLRKIGLTVILNIIQESSRTIQSNRFLSREELHNLFEYCKKSKNPHLYGMVLIAASMGLRFGETANLQWKHVDFVNGFVTLETTKNGDRRVVPLPDQLAKYLKNLERSKPPEEFLFPSKDPSKRHAPSLIRKAFQKALKDAGIENFKYHDLRHTCASHLAMNGATQGELMEILGHRSPTMTKRYAHFSKEHIARVLQKTSNNLIGHTGETL